MIIGLMMPTILQSMLLKSSKDYPTAIRGQFQSWADAIVINLVICLHDYKQYTMKLTSAVGKKDIHPLGEGFLHLPAPTPSEFLAVYCFYSPRLSSTLVSPCEILKMSKNGEMDLVVKI